MLKETLLKNSHIKSKTVHNALITLGDIDDSGKGKRFKSRFIQPGLAGYPGQFGNVLVRKETLDNSLKTIVGAPVIINHKDVTEENADDLRVGVISNAYYNADDGWYWCEGVIWDETAQNLVNDKGWSVSCSYDFLEEDTEGGTENNIPYDREFTKLNFVHLALVNNPRYERANIVFNSKTSLENGNSNSGHYKHAGIKGFRGGSLPKGYNSNFINELDNLIKLATEDKQYNGEILIGSLSNHAQKAADNYKKDLSEYTHTIDAKAIRHRNNHHLKGEPDDITDDDLKLIPYIIYNPDKVTYYQRKQIDHINYEKKMPNGDYLYIEEVRNGNKTLTTKTIYKKLAASNVENSTNEVTFKTSANTNIINDVSEDFNPNEDEILQSVNNDNKKEQDMAIIDELKKLINTVENGKGEEKEMDKEKEVDNEKVDKRKLIDEVGGILKGKVDEEVWRTIIGKIEKLGYNESERGTADNEAEKEEPKKDKEEVEELKKEVKEDVENKKKCDNAVDNAKPDYFNQINNKLNALQKAIAKPRDIVSRKSFSYFSGVS